MSFADLLTVLRLILVPFFLWAYATDQWPLALIFFAIAGATDLIDGTIARLLKTQSPFGAILDPIADKALMGAAFTCLWLSHIVPVWFFLLIIGRDLMIVGGLAYIQWRRIKTRLKPYWTSKLATLCQIITVIVALLVVLLPSFQLWGRPLQSYLQFFLSLTVLLVVISGVQYLWRGWWLLKNVKATV